MKDKEYYVGNKVLLTFNDIVGKNYVNEPCVISFKHDWRMPGGSYEYVYNLKTKSGKVLHHMTPETFVEDTTLEKKLNRILNGI